MSQVRNLVCWPVTQAACLCPSQHVPYSLSWPLVRFYTLWGDMERMNHAAPCQKCSEGCRCHMVSMSPANRCSDFFIYLCCVIFSCFPSLCILPKMRSQWWGLILWMTEGKQGLLQKGTAWLRTVTKGLCTFGYTTGTSLLPWLHTSHFHISWMKR